MLMSKRSARAALLALAAVASCSKKLPAPVAAFEAPGAAHVGVRVQLDGSASAPGDPGTPLVFHWTLSAKPAGSHAALENDAGAFPRLLPDVAGDYAVRLVVQDLAESAPALHTIAAKADCAPQVTAASAT